MSDIGWATGLSAGAIYNHFSSKDEISSWRQPVMDMAPSIASAPNSPGLRVWVEGAGHPKDSPSPIRHTVRLWQCRSYDRGF